MIKYSEDHEWIDLNGDTGTVGISPHAIEQLGDIVFVDVDTEGESLDQDEVFGSVEAVKTVSDLYLPVAGEIIEFNEALEDSPEAVNDDPYGEGWMVKIKMSDTSQLDDLMDSDAYQAMLG